MQALLRYCKNVPQQEYSNVSPSLSETQPRCFQLMCGIDTEAEHVPWVEDGESAVAASRTRTQGSKDTVPTDFLNLDGPRIVGLGPAIQFCPSSITSSLPVQLPIDPPSSTVPDHTELAATNPSPVTRNFDAAGLQEGDQDEPAKKKVHHFQYSDAVDITYLT